MSKKKLSDIFESDRKELRDHTLRLSDLTRPVLKNYVSVRIDTFTKTFILVPKDMPKEKVERLKLKYKNNIEKR